MNFSDCMKNFWDGLLRPSVKPLLFALWTGGAFWVCSPRFVDAEVTPQWLWAVAGGAVWLLLAGHRPAAGTGGGQRHRNMRSSSSSRRMTKTGRPSGV